MVTTGPIAFSTGGRLIWFWLTASMVSICLMLPTPRAQGPRAPVKVLETLSSLWNDIDLTHGANSVTHAAIEQEVHVTGAHARGGACGFSSPRRLRGGREAQVWPARPTS